jgi:SAM-dependent methyltransferase
MNRIKALKKKVLEDQFFRPEWYSVFLNPYFINRNSLYQAMRKFAKSTRPDSRILDVGCGIKPYRSLFKTPHYSGIDIEGGGHADDAKHVDKYYDGLNIPFQDHAFSTLICTQVLEHADDPEQLVKECSRVLSSGGTAFFSMPFIYPEHEKPYDFRRFTRFEHERLLRKNGFESVEIFQTTGFFGTFGQMLVVFAFESMTFRASILKSLLSLFIFGPIQTISLFLDFIFNKSGPTMDYVITAVKK